MLALHDFWQSLPLRASASHGLITETVLIDNSHIAACSDDSYLKQPVQQGDSAVDGTGGVQLCAGGHVQLQCILQLGLQGQTLSLQGRLCAQSCSTWSVELVCTL